MTSPTQTAALAGSNFFHRQHADEPDLASGNEFPAVQACTSPTIKKTKPKTVKPSDDEILQIVDYTNSSTPDKNKTHNTADITDKTSGTNKNTYSIVQDVKICRLLSLEA